MGGAVIYTDGSLISASSVGGSSAILLDGREGEESVTEGLAVCLIGASSSFEVEVRALLLAVELIARHPREGCVVICSDSRSALDALRLPLDGDDDGITRLRQELMQVGLEIRLQWVPGHCGLRGNEIADRVAKAASGVGTRARTPVGDASLGGSLSEDAWVVDEGWDVGPSVFESNDERESVGSAVCDVERIWRGRVRFLGVENVGRSYAGALSHIRRVVFDPLRITLE